MIELRPLCLDGGERSAGEVQSFPAEGLAVLLALAEARGESLVLRRKRTVLRRQIMIGDALLVIMIAQKRAGDHADHRADRPARRRPNRRPRQDADAPPA